MNALSNLKALHPADTHFIANLVARQCKRHALGFHCLAELAEAHIVLCGNAADRIVQFGIADAHSATVGHLQLDAFQNHALQYLATQDAGRWQWRTGVLALHVINALLQLAVHDDVVIDNGDNMVDGYRRCLSTAGHQAKPQQAR